MTKDESLRLQQAEIARLRDEITVDEQRVADLMGDVQRQGLENEKLRDLLRDVVDMVDGPCLRVFDGVTDRDIGSEIREALGDE